MQHVGKRASWIVTGSVVGGFALLAWAVAQQGAPSAAGTPETAPPAEPAPLGDAATNPQDVAYRAMEKLAAEVAVADRERIRDARAIAGEWYSPSSQAAMPSTLAAADAPFRPTFLRLSPGEPGHASLSVVDGSLRKVGAWAVTNDGLRTAGELGDRNVVWEVSADGQTLTLRGAPFAEAGETFRRIGAGGYNSIVAADYAERMRQLRALNGYWIGKVPFVDSASDLVVYFGGVQDDPQPRYADGNNLPTGQNLQTLRQGTPFRTRVFVRTLDGKPLVETRAMVSSLGLQFSPNGHVPGKIRAADATVGNTYRATFGPGIVQFDGGKQLIPMTDAQFRAYVLAYRGKRTDEIAAQAERDRQVRDQLAASGVPLPTPYVRNPAAQPGAASGPMPGMPAAGAAGGAAPAGGMGGAPMGGPPMGGPPMGGPPMGAAGGAAGASTAER